MARILVVDDEPLIVETVCAILEAKGYSTVGVNSGLEAIAQAETSCPDVLLTDVVMPGLNGFETASRVKERCPGCRLLFFSGYAAAPHVINNLTSSSQILEVLPKPLPSAMLLEKVKAALQNTEETEDAKGHTAS